MTTLPAYAPKICPIRFAIVTLYTPEIDAWAVPIADGKREYCQRHGYEFFEYRQKHPEAEGYHPSWSKLHYMRDLCRSGRFDWIHWSDADALIFDHRLPLHEIAMDAQDWVLINQKETPAIVISNDDYSGVNMGAFFLPGNETAAQAMEAVWALRDNREIEMIDHWWEQAALRHLLMAGEAPVTMVCNRNEPWGWNTFSRDAWKIKNRIGQLHLTGHPDRAAVLPDLLSRVMR